MLDSNLPTFFLKPSPDGLKHHESFYFTQHGSEPEAIYSLRHADPASVQAKNTYAAALFDSHYPEILYGEVLAKPGWSQPTLSQEEIRKNGGVPPPPQPIFPTEFAIQLYNPETQVVVTQQTTKWSNTVTYEFSMPQTTFRTPSASTLDRSLNDPGADASTPKINFVWRKEGRKDMTCYMTGKSTDPTGKKAKKNKEPDIVVALFSGLKEMTVMEGNLYRVEMEDYKGLEVVLVLSAAVIRDLFFNSAREAYHIIDPNTRKNSGGLLGRKGSSPIASSGQGAAQLTIPPVMTPQPPSRPQVQPPTQTPPRAQRPLQPAPAPALNGLYNQPSRNDSKRTSLPALQTGNQPAQRLDPRAQWEIDAETARLKAEVEAEAQEQKRQRDRARRRLEEEEARKTQEFLQNEERQRKKEEKDRRRRQAEVDKETERLRKQFGDQSNLLPPRQPSFQQQQQPPAQRPVQPARPHAPQGPYLQAPHHRPAASQSSFFGNSNSSGSGMLRPDAPQRMRKKKSFFGFGSASTGDASPSTLRKKQSSMF